MLAGVNSSRNPVFTENTGFPIKTFGNDIYGYFRVFQQPAKLLALNFFHAIASPSLSPVLTFTAPSIGDTNIFPSPCFPV